MSEKFRTMLDAQLPQKAPPLKELSVASLFAGVGGFDLGFRSAGLKVKFATDYWDKATAAYKINFGHAAVCRDVRDLSGSDVPAVDCITGGFPCVTFSKVGQRHGVVDDEAGQLYLEMCRLIDEVKPRFFVAENVRGLLSANRGNAIKLMVAAFLRQGYRVEHKLVRMVEFGVPQTRERVILVGVRLDQWQGSFRFPQPTHRYHERGAKKLPAWLPRAYTLRDAIDDLNPDIKVMYVEHADAALKRRQGGVTPGYTNSRPRAATRPSHSEVASSPNLITFDDCSTRRMTVREGARVQTFPDWFQFPGSASDGHRMVGNAVPPLYAKKLGEALLLYDKGRG